MDNTENNLPDKKETLQDRFARNLFIYPTPYEAAVEAGYSKESAKGYIYNLLKKDTFKQKML